jgi:hypothetical protein
MTQNIRITIDPEVLTRAGSDLQRSSERLGEDAQTLGGASLASGAFGLMNAWMVPPVQALAGQAREFVQASGQVSAAIGLAAVAAAQDFADTEQRIIGVITALEEELG